jgi:hypothetical protein
VKAFNLPAGLQSPFRPSISLQAFNMPEGLQYPCRPSISLKAFNLPAGLQSPCRFHNELNFSFGAILMVFVPLAG